MKVLPAAPDVIAAAVSLQKADWMLTASTKKSASGSCCGTWLTAAVLISWLPVGCEQICFIVVDNWEDLEPRQQTRAGERVMKRWWSLRDRFKREFNNISTQGPVVPPVDDVE
ncbi:uncharacterized protein LOC143777900 [Ranitomeya variabilis]|uniref:uncharacterized protein LOC143777900 n=1 Tax=Ranitomeya variabilis TaxID=490064 RepID=UPI004055E2EA